MLHIPSKISFNSQNFSGLVIATRDESEDHVQATMYQDKYFMFRSYL
jgi:hypothetical protein